MAKKTLGYTELQWACPNCNALNPGSQKTCTQCGAPQPENVVFKQVTGAELLQDEAVKERVKAGADIHCPYCKARNPGDAKTCTQCGGDLETGARREHGAVLGAYKKEPPKNRPCPVCGAENLETARICTQCGGSMQTGELEETIPEPGQKPIAQPGKKGLPIALIIILVVICFAAVALIFLSMRTEAVTGVVNGVKWERSIAIEGLTTVEYQKWFDQVPSDGEILSCQQEVRSISNEPQPGAEEICGTPYSVDTGSGYAEVVQDCEYHVYDDFCTYSVIEWAVVDTKTQSGNDFYPDWPDPVILAEQRLGEQNETYLISFETSQGDFTYSINDFEAFQEFQIGTEWDLEINTFGELVSVAP